MDLTRRQAARTAAAVTALSYSRILGANSRIGLGVIGMGERGSYVMSLFQKNAEVEVRAVCDVYNKRRDEAQQKAPGARAFNEHERLLELREIDAVLIGSPDHWHHTHAVDAMRAGKDVYVEKPLCRTREEAPLMVKAARIHNRVCQVGVQQRSGEVYIEAKSRFLDAGALGRVTHIDAVWHSGVPQPLPRDPAQKPDGLDWVRFLGPVKYRDWNPAQYLDFRAFLDFNGGKLTDFGHHWLDVVHMYMGERPPHSVVFAGGIFGGLADGRTAPDTCNALFEYGSFSVLFQSNAYGTGAGYGVTFYGTQGKLFVDRNHYVFTPEGDAPRPVQRSIPGDITSTHVRNFLDCVVSRKQPNGDVGIASISVLPPLLAVQSYFEQRRIRFDPDRLEVLPF